MAFAFHNIAQRNHPALKTVAVAYAQQPPFLVNHEAFLAVADQIFRRTLAFCGVG